MTDYRDAVKALASSITSTKTGLSDEKKMGIARNILSRKNLDRRDIDIDISDEKDFQILRDYLGSLQRTRRANMGAEIEDSIDNAKRLSALRDQLEEDLSEAYDEDKELESIAQRLQDKGLGKVAGKEESQINDLGTSLEKLVNKGKEVDKMEETLENVLSEHGLEKNGLDQELRKRAKTVSRLISEYGEASETVDIDSIVDTIAGEQALLERAESRGKKSLEEDIRKLRDLYGHRDAESLQLDKLEEELREGKFDEAESSLELILTDRKGVLTGDYSTLKELHEDLEDSMKIASGLKKLFNRIDVVKSRDDIDENEFYSKLANRLGLSDRRDAEQFIGRLQKDYGGLKDELEKIEDLKEHSLERDKSNYEKIRQIDQEDSKLRREASSMEAQQKLKDIHEKLQKLGYELENEIEIEGGDASNSESSLGSQDSDSNSVRGPDPSGSPWIVSISDIHGNVDEATEVFQGLVRAGFKPVVDENWNWEGNNYILVFNGDSFDGRDGRGENSPKVFEGIKNLRENQGRRIIHTYGNHDMFIPTAEFQKLILERHGRYNDPFFNYCIENPGVRSWILNQMEANDGMYRAAYSKYDFTYTHTGYTYKNAESDLEEFTSKVLEILSDESKLNNLFNDLRQNNDSFRSSVSNNEKRPSNISRSKANQLSVCLNPDESVQNIDNDLKMALLTGFLQYEEYDKLWNLTTKRWKDVSLINHSNPKIIGHNKKGSCNSGTSIWGAGTNPRTEGKLVNENTIRDGDNPCLMLEDPNGELIAIRKDGETQKISSQ